MATDHSGDQVAVLDKSNEQICVNEEVLDIKVPYSKSNKTAQDEILLEPFTYLLRKKGKGMKTVRKFENLKLMPHP